MARKSWSQSLFAPVFSTALSLACLRGPNTPKIRVPASRAKCCILQADHPALPEDTANLFRPSKHFGLQAKLCRSS